MAEKEPETQYTPKGHEIPIATRRQVLGDLAKGAEPQKPLPRKRSRKRRPKQ